jgi:hypothetical protein
MSTLSDYSAKPHLYERDKLQVKFRDNFQIRLRKDRLVDLRGKGLTSSTSKKLLSTVGDGVWIRGHQISEKKLDYFRKNGMALTGKKLPDLNNYFVLVLPAGRRDALDLIAKFEKLKEVEFAAPLSKPVPPPTVPDFADLERGGAVQTYLGPSTNNGVDAFFAWTFPGGDGAGVSICDIEYTWNFDHGEFQANQGLRLCGDSPLNPFGDWRGHGTAAVGVYGSSNDGEGTTGIAFNVNKFASTALPARLVPWWDVVGAIDSAMDVLSPGDIILIEVGWAGPNTDYLDEQEQGEQGVPGMAPVEWNKAVYDSIITATANGYIVVECAGNGSENLDSSIYEQEDHKPFLPENNSGAIMVGAGHPTNRTRLDFSNFGSRVDVQGWGAGVVAPTANPGSHRSPEANLWSADGDNLFYTHHFGGTSSAGAMIAGCCACLQGIFKSRFGRAATPKEMLELLKKSDRVQGGIGAALEHIGPLPDLRQAIGYLDSLIPRAPSIDPQSGDYPLPLKISIDPSYGHIRTNDFKTWYTLDGSEPSEDSPNTELLDGPIVLFRRRDNTIKAKNFNTDQLTGERIGGPTASETYTLYFPVPGPRNVRATQGSSVDKVVITWDSLPDAQYYEVITGSLDHPLKINSSPIVETQFEDIRGAGLGQQTSYWVRAIFPNNRVTRYSGPAIGWSGIEPLTVQASKGTFDDHILVSWSYPSWNPDSWDIEFTIYRGVLDDIAQAIELTQIKPKTRTVPVGRRVIQLPDGISTEYEDSNVVRGTTYYYWVKAKEKDGTLETPIGETESGYLS